MERTTLDRIEKHPDAYRNGLAFPSMWVGFWGSTVLSSLEMRSAKLGDGKPIQWTIDIKRSNYSVGQLPHLLHLTSKERRVPYHST